MFPTLHTIAQTVGQTFCATTAALVTGYSIENFANIFALGSVISDVTEPKSWYTITAYNANGLRCTIGPAVGQIS